MGSTPRHADATRSRWHVSSSGPTGALSLANVYTSEPAQRLGVGDEPQAVAHERAVALLRSVAAEETIDAELRSIPVTASAPVCIVSPRRLARTCWCSDPLRRAARAAYCCARTAGTRSTAFPARVAVAPLGYAEIARPVGVIGVAYNGSDESREAVAAARALAAQLHATATAFEALPVPACSLGQDAWDSFNQQIHDRRQHARDRIALETGLEAYASCGEATEEIAVFSGSVDLLVIGSRDYGPLGRLVHGSTNHRLLRFARSPLLMLTRSSLRLAEDLGRGDCPRRRRLLTAYPTKDHATRFLLQHIGGNHAVSRRTFCIE